MATESTERKERESLADSTYYPNDIDVDSSTQIPAEPPGELSLEKTQHHIEADSPRPATGFRWLLIVSGLFSTAFLYGLDNTIVADIQGAVVETYDDVGRLSWMGSGFPLGSISVILVFSKCFGIFDNKWMYIGCITVFAIGSAICGAAPTMNVLIVGRVIAGLGAAGQYLGGLNLLTRFTTMQERSAYMGIMGLVWGTGTILGPVIGGLFADSPATWRWAFYINLVILGALSPVFVFMIPSTPALPNETRSIAARLATIDWLGALLNAGIYVTWVLALQFGGVQWAWSDGRTIATFVVFGVLVVAFAVQQWLCLFTSAEDRLFPVQFLSSRTMVLMFVLTSCWNAINFVVMFYIPVFFQFTHGDSGIDSAVRLLPFVICLVFGMLLNGFLMPRFPLYMPWWVVTGVLTTIGCALLYAIGTTPTASSSSIYGFTVLIGLGSGLTTQAGYSVAAAHAATSPSFGPQHIPAAIGFLNVAQIGCIVHALAIGGAIFQNYAFNNLNAVFAAAGLAFEESEVRQAVAGVGSRVFEQLGGEVRELAVAAIVDAVRRVYVLCLAGAVAGLVGAVVLRRERLFVQTVAGG